MRRIGLMSRHEPVGEATGCAARAGRRREELAHGAMRVEPPHPSTATSPGFKSSTSAISSAYGLSPATTL
jgi:hypothetical protein